MVTSTSSQDEQDGASVAGAWEATAANERTTKIQFAILQRYSIFGVRSGLATGPVLPCSAKNSGRRVARGFTIKRFGYIHQNHANRESRLSYVWRGGFAGVVIHMWPFSLPWMRHWRQISWGMQWSIWRRMPCSGTSDMKTSRLSVIDLLWQEYVRVITARFSGEWRRSSYVQSRCYYKNRYMVRNFGICSKTEYSVYFGLLSNSHSSEYSKLVVITVTIPYNYDAKSQPYNTVRKLSHQDTH